MKTHQWQLKYVQWFSAEEMHEATKNWESELGFIQDEQLFFEHLLKQSMELSASPGNMSSIQDLSDELGGLKKECDLLVSEVLSHLNKLDVLVDGINQIREEDIYKETHQELVDAIGEFLIKHQQLKKDLFNVVKKQLKDQS